jgi:D-aminopeptidase
LSAPEAHRRIREGIQRAVRRQQEDPLPPLRWDGPYVLEKRFFHTDVADRASVQPGAERVDSQTVRYRGENILDIIYR